MRDRDKELVLSVPVEERPVTAMAIAVRDLRGHGGDEASLTADILEAEAAIGTLDRLGWSLRPAREPDATALRAQVARLADESATAEVVILYARRLCEVPRWRLIERWRRATKLAAVLRWYDGRAAGC